MVSTPVIFGIGCVLGWLSHQRYGDSLIAGISGDASSLWLELDTDGDGNVSFEEFEQGMKKKMGSLCPGTNTLKVTYEGIVRVKRAGIASKDDLKKAIDNKFR